MLKRNEVVTKMTMNIDILLVKVILVLCFFGITGLCQEVGERCTLKNTGETGTCKIHSDCPGIEELGRRNLHITLCGFYQLTTPVVCCKNQQSSQPNPNDLSIEEIIFSPDDIPNLQENSFFGGAARKSEQKCLEYNKDLTDVVHAIPLVTNVEPISINVSRCEYNSVALIVGGTLASSGEFPFMVALGFPDSDDKPEWKCGGTLISDRWILTAAHCTFDRDDNKPKWARLGALDMSKPYEDGRVDFLIDRIIVHPEYKYPLKYNDIGLLSTNRKVKFSSYIRPACLYTKPEFPQDALATGWGQTDYSPNSDKLLKVKLSIFDNNFCLRSYKNNKNDLPRGIVKSMVCAGDRKAEGDTCFGDSGGPLFITEKENLCKFYIVGITSFGKSCALENVPAVYTRVSEYISWIERIIW